MKERQDEQLKSQVSDYWNTNPMDYNVTPDAGSREYFLELDRKNSKWGTPMEGSTHPDAQGLIDYERDIAGKRVLEVGIGLGSLFGSLARRASLALGVDLTAFGTQMSKRRAQLFDLPHMHPIHADAERLPFEDEAFDTVVSWGVIHHTPDTPRAAREIWRVLKPGGTALVMIYHRNSVFYWYKIFVGWGILRGELLRYSPQEITNRHLDPDSPLNKVYSIEEGRQMFSAFQKVDIKITGSAGFDSLPVGRFPFISQLLMRGERRKRLLARYGYFMWIRAVK
ncbi:MAG: methyltransferase domain-containing protein [Chloroflexota bacterium]|nr:methyltransferase domain-containing protein [Chloroflexota bacterium]